MSGGSYDADFYSWTQEQARALRSHASMLRNVPVDWENIAVEIEDMGKSERRALESYLANVIEHLLKLAHSPATAPRLGWEKSTYHARQEARAILRDSPGLKSQMDSIIATAWSRGRYTAAMSLAHFDNLGGETLPEDCPYSFQQLIAEDWYPNPDDPSGGAKGQGQD